MKENVKTGKSFGIECIRAIGEVLEENLPPGSPIQVLTQLKFRRDTSPVQKVPQWYLASPVRNKKRLIITQVRSSQIVTNVEKVLHQKITVSTTWRAAHNLT
jgi:hypothetical protein